MPIPSGNALRQTWPRIQRSIDRQNMHMLVQLRWLAVVGQAIAISLVHHVFGIDLPLPTMALVLLALVLLNLASNAAALALFAAKGHVWWHLAAPMAAANVLGAILGARVALRYGAGFVRIVFIAVVGALILKTTLDAFGASG